MPLQLAFEALGDGPPVIVLHGLFGSSRNWRGVARALSAQHRVFCVDLRNHGRSPWIDSMSYAEMAADVRALIDSEGLDRPVVIGHSMGGKTAMALALENPASVGRLIVVDIAPVSYADRLTPYVEAMLSINPRTTADRAEAMRLMGEKIPDAAAVGFLLQNLTVRDDHFDWRLNLPAIGAAVPALCAFPPELSLRRFDGPALLIAGSMSDYVSPGDHAAFAELFAQARFTQIEGAGHWVHADRPAEFLNALGLLHEATA
jgi:pimeloyl-ACP methyl ester carboxylesterase